MAILFLTLTLDPPQPSQPSSTSPSSSPDIAVYDSSESPPPLHALLINPSPSPTPPTSNILPSLPTLFLLPSPGLQPAPPAKIVIAPIAVFATVFVLVVATVVAFIARDEERKIVWRRDGEDGDDEDEDEEVDGGGGGGVKEVSDAGSFDPRETTYEETSSGENLERHDLGLETNIAETVDGDSLHHDYESNIYNPNPNPNPSQQANIPRRPPRALASRPRHLNTLDEDTRTSTLPPSSRALHSNNTGKSNAHSRSISRHLQSEITPQPNYPLPPNSNFLTVPNTQSPRWSPQPQRQSMADSFISDISSGYAESALNLGSDFEGSVRLSRVSDAVVRGDAY